jgi:nitrate/nitrite transporter NarK
MVAQRSAFWLSSVLTGINVAGSGLGRILGGATARPGRETRAVLRFYVLVIAAAAALLFSSSVVVILTLAALVAMVSSMGFAPLMRLAIQVGGPRLQGTAVGFVLALGMLIGSVLPTLFGWVVGLTGSFTMGFLVVLAAPLTGFLAMLRFQSRCASGMQGP